MGYVAVCKIHPATAVQWGSMTPTLLAELTRLKKESDQGINQRIRFDEACGNAFQEIRDELLRLRGENEKMKLVIKTLHNEDQYDFGMDYGVIEDKKTSEAFEFASKVAYGNLTLASPDGTVEVGEK